LYRELSEHVNIHSSYETLFTYDDVPSSYLLDINVTVLCMPLMLQVIFETWVTR